MIPEALERARYHSADKISNRVFETDEFDYHVMFGLQLLPELGKLALLENLVNF